MNRLSSVMLCAQILLSLASLAAQETVVRTSRSGEVFMIPEVGAVLRADGGTVKVELALPGESRPAGYRDVDIETGDIVLFLNGKRIKALAEFSVLFDSLKIGELVEIGLKRDEQRFISAFKKADPKDSPQARMMTVTADGNDVTTTELQGGQRRLMVEPTEAELQMDDLQPIIELAVIIGSKDKQVEVGRKLPLPTEGLDITLEVGDVLLALNGKKLESPAQFAEIFGAIKVGEQVELKYRRQGKELTTTFAKPQPRGTIRLRTENN